jgi:mono/diheme cytochrome c family protein
VHHNKNGTAMRGFAIGWLAWMTWLSVSTAWAAPPTASQAQVERGRYLARVANCVACHTAEGGAPMAGGLPLQTGAGTVYSTNITPEASTGLGRYSLDDFDRAVRRGVARDGRRLYPAMPYPSYARMTRDDVAAVYAWLRAEVKPVAQTNRDAQMRWPYSMRWLMVPWNLLHLEEGPIPASADRGAAWNRGAYLVQAVAHCGACHTRVARCSARKGPIHAAATFCPAQRSRVVGHEPDRRHADRARRLVAGGDRRVPAHGAQRPCHVVRADVDGHCLVNPVHDPRRS